MKIRNIVAALAFIVSGAAFADTSASSFCQPATENSLACMFEHVNGFKVEGDSARQCDTDLTTRGIYRSGESTDCALEMATMAAILNHLNATSPYHYVDLSSEVPAMAKFLQAAGYAKPGANFVQGLEAFVRAQSTTGLAMLNKDLSKAALSPSAADQAALVKAAIARDKAVR